MPHARQIIRDAVVSSLSGLTIGAEYVYNTRLNAFRTLPVVNVSTSVEVVRNDLGSMNDDNEQYRELSLVVEGIEDDRDTLDSVLDSIAEEIEQCVLSDSYLNSSTSRIEIESVSYEYNRDGEQAVCKMEMAINIIYKTDGDSPSSIL